MDPSNLDHYTTAQLLDALRYRPEVALEYRDGMRIIMYIEGSPLIKQHAPKAPEEHHGTEGIATAPRSS